MGLVILSVFVFSFAIVACGDSNTGEAVPPTQIVPPGNGGGGQEPGPEPATNPIERLVVTGRVNMYSKEGQAPVISGITVDVWYKDGSVKRPALSQFATIPAILGEAETNASDPTEAQPVAVLVYHPDDPSVTATVLLPGVNALAFTSRGAATDNVATNDAHIDATAGAVAAAAGEAAVFGAGPIGAIGTGAEVTIASGARVTGTFFQDGGLPDFGYPTVYVRYQGLTTPSWVPEEDAAYNSEETGDGDQGSTVLWEQIKLDERYVFSDYDRTFRTPATQAAAGKRFAYGIDDEQGFVYFLVSKGRYHGSRVAAGSLTAQDNSTVYVRVPWHDDNFKFYYVRAVEVQTLTWESRAGGGNYLTQSEAMDVTNWNNKLLGRSDFTLRVYYHDYADGYKDRGIDFYRRAVQLGVAGIVNDPVRSLLMDSGEEGFGELLIGYYTSALDNTTPRDPFNNGDFTNAARYKLPIAIFNEGSAVLDKKEAAKEPGDLVFIAPSAAYRGAINAQQLEAIGNTYDLNGTFTLPAGGTVKDLLIPGEDFQLSFFSGTPLAVRNEIVEAEVTLVVPNQNTLNRDFGAGSAEAVKYGLYIGEEGTFTATVFPYDWWDNMR